MGDVFFCIVEIEDILTLTYLLDHYNCNLTSTLAFSYWLVSSGVTHLALLHFS